MKAQKADGQVKKVFLQQFGKPSPSRETLLPWVKYVFQFKSIEDSLWSSWSLCWVVTHAPVAALEVHCTSPYENDRPLFLLLNGAVNSASLLEMLSYVLQLTNRGIMEQVWFQKDGAAAHFTLTRRVFLNKAFHCSWISCSSQHPI
jgi:hypothetical protein